MTSTTTSPDVARQTTIPGRDRPRIRRVGGLRKTRQVEAPRTILPAVIPRTMTTIPAAAHRMTTMIRVGGHPEMTTTTQVVDHQMTTMMTIHPVTDLRATTMMMTTIRPAVAHLTMTTIVETVTTVREPARSWTA